MHLIVLIQVSCDPNYPNVYQVFKFEPFFEYLSLSRRDGCGAAGCCLYLDGSVDVVTRECLPNDDRFRWQYDLSTSQIKSASNNQCLYKETTGRVVTSACNTGDADQRFYSETVITNFDRNLCVDADPGSGNNLYMVSYSIINCVICLDCGPLLIASTIPVWSYWTWWRV